MKLLASAVLVAGLSLCSSSALAIPPYAPAHPVSSVQTSFCGPQKIVVERQWDGAKSRHSSYRISVNDEALSEDDLEIVRGAISDHGDFQATMVVCPASPWSEIIFIRYTPTAKRLTIGLDGKKLRDLRLFDPEISHRNEPLFSKLKQ